MGRNRACLRDPGSLAIEGADDCLHISRRRRLNLSFWLFDPAVSRLAKLDIDKLFGSGGGPRKGNRGSAASVNMDDDIKNGA